MRFAAGEFSSEERGSIVGLGSMITRAGVSDGEGGRWDPVSVRVWWCRIVLAFWLGTGQQPNVKTLRRVPSHVIFQGPP